MKKKLKFLFFVLLSGSLSLILAIVILIYMNATRYPVTGWGELKQSTMNMHDSIKNITITRVIPIEVAIQFVMKADFQYDEVDPLFEKMREAVENKAFYEELQQLHIKQKKYPFVDLKINFSYIVDGRRYTNCQYHTFAPQIDPEVAAYTGMMEWRKSCSTLSTSSASVG